MEIREITERNEAKVKVAFEYYNETTYFEKANKKGNSKELIKTALLERLLMDGNFVIKHDNSQAILKPLIGGFFML